MKLSEHKSSTRDRVADLLSDLSQALAKDGVVSVDGVKVAMPESLDTKLKYREKDGRHKLKISLSWAGEPGEFAGPGTVAGAYAVPLAPPTNFKQLKKEMQHALFYFKRLTDGGGCPGAEEIERYRRLQAAFASASPSQWREGIAEADLATEALAAACGANDAIAAGLAIERLLTVKKRYHDIYK